MHYSQKFKCVLLCALAVISLVSIYDAIRKQNNKPAVTRGTPVQYFEDLDINTISIDQIANDDAQLYLLDADEGILRVFNLNGNYLYTLIFFDYMNGAFKLAVDNNRLYVSDPHGDVYVFDECKFNQFIERKDAKNSLKAIDFENNPTNYEMRGVSVWKISETGDFCVIERSLPSIRYQSKIFMLILVGIFVVLHLYVTF